MWADRMKTRLIRQRFPRNPEIADTTPRRSSWMRCSPRSRRFHGNMRSLGLAAVGLILACAIADHCHPGFLRRHVQARSDTMSCRALPSRFNSEMDAASFAHQSERDDHELLIGSEQRAKLAGEVKLDDHAELICSLLQRGLASDRADFDRRTREALTDTSLDCLSVDYLLLSRGLVLGPMANVGIDRTPFANSCTRAFLASLGARELARDTSPSALHDIAVQVLCWPLLAGESRLAFLHLAASSMGRGAESLRGPFGPILDKRVVPAFITCLEESDDSCVAFGLEYL